MSSYRGSFSNLIQAELRLRTNIEKDHLYQFPLPLEADPNIYFPPLLNPNNLRNPILHDQYRQQLKQMIEERALRQTSFPYTISDQPELFE